MGKIPNWSRRNDLEGHTVENTENRTIKTVRAWQNDNNDAIAALRMFDYEDNRTTEYELKVSMDTKFQTRKNQPEAISETTDWLENHQYSGDDIPEDSDDLHARLLEVGKDVEPQSQGVANDLDDDEIRTIVGTVDFFDNKGLATKQTKSDLTPPTSYRVFDWLGMMMTSGLDNKVLDWLFDELARIYIQEKSVNGFVHQLRQQDLQLQMPSDLRRR